MCPQNLGNVSFVLVFWVFFSLVFSNFLSPNIRLFEKVAALLNESTTLPFIALNKNNVTCDKVSFLGGKELAPKQKGKQDCLSCADT